MNRPEKSEYSFGTSPDCDVVIVDSQVKQEHCKLERRQGKWWVNPLQGPVGIRVKEKGIQWKRSSFEVKPNDDLWLSTQSRFPWPIESDSLETFIVGRAIDCDVTIDQESVSGRHASLIVDPRGNLLLCDLQSRNGMFVDSNLNHRVRSIAPQIGQTIYFGSTSIDCDLFFSAVKQRSVSPADLHEARSDFTQSESKTSAAGYSANTLSAFLRPWLAVSTSAVLVVGTFYVYKHKTTRSDIASRAAIKAPIEDSGSMISRQISDATPELVPESIAPVRDSVTAEESSDNDARIVDSLFWVMVRETKSQTYFRLGAGLAYGKSRVITTASVMQSIDRLVAAGYSSPAVIPVVGGSPVLCGPRKTWDVFQNRNQRSQLVGATYQGLIENKAPPNEVANAAQVVNFALSAESATDFGWIDVVANLTDSMQFMAKNESGFRPGEAVEIPHVGFDIADPALEIDARPWPRVDRQIRGRVRGRGVNLNQIPGTIEIQISDQMAREINMIGLPLLSQGEIIGMVVHQSEAGQNREIRVEAVPISTIKTAMGSIEESGDLD